MKKNTPPQQLHMPVLLEQTLLVLGPKKGESYLDLTAGYGGHAKAVIDTTGVPSKAVLVDRDENAIAELGSFQAQGATLLHTDFYQAAQQLAKNGQRFDMVLLDLGVSSPQLDRAERGFSFAHGGPLDMRMDNREPRTAADLVNTLGETELAELIWKYGEEPKSRAIAKAIVHNRPFTTTDQLATTVATATRWGRSKVHPATRTFQALRIAVNRELELLESTLSLLPSLLTPGGRVAIISFHSLEDRIVKHFLKDLTEAGYEAEFAPLTKKPISGATEDVHNPRARSAKLRAAVKIKNQKERS
ncbi:MAG TPA: 16S rRNA (cytosine(1402)-N(4))-methyltransferase RsmH [Candidatus Saccharimonadales bacterium]|nr:16S rRNA (cytosine(1402)-N(4))-methyltransferase RsmH [Candidatus Saccharimonadales bacterium]